MQVATPKKGYKLVKTSFGKYEEIPEEWEITKLHEEYIRKNIDELEPFAKNPKGELTIVISEKNENKNTSQKLSESDKIMIKKMINKISIKEMTSLISYNKNVSKNLLPGK